MAISIRCVRIAAIAAALSVSMTVAFAQTEIKLPKNKYTPEQDAKLGREAAAQVRQQYPVITDDRIAKYLTALGDRLVAVAPPELKHPAFQYSFTAVNVRDINAFALPGGPMFVNRGMFDAAAEEGEVVGVMAHELSHVLLRHGTANVSKAQNPWMQIGQIAGQIGGAMVGGGAGSMIAQGSQMGLGALLLRYSRDFEKQADLLGAQIMAKAGYDPRALAHMFETIAKQSQGSGGGGKTPQWLSSHPDPGNRTMYITKEAGMLAVATAADGSGFQPIKSSFASLPPPKSMAEVEKGGGGGGNAGRAAEAPPNTGTPGQPVPAPSSNFTNMQGGKVFQVSVPDNWTGFNSNGSIRVVPQNGYGQLNGQTVFSHGVEFGVIKATSSNLVEATNVWLKAVAQSNPELKLAGSQQQVQISQRSGLATPLLNASPVGGAERIGLYTAFVAEGALFYYLTVVPEKDAAVFQETFKRIGESIRINEMR